MSFWKLLLIAALALTQAGSSGRPLTNFRGVVLGAAPETTVFVQRWDRDKESKQFRAFNPPPIHLDSNGKFATYLPPGLYDVFVSSYSGEPIALKVEIAPLTPTELECESQLSPLVPTAGPFLITPSKQSPPLPSLHPRPSSCVARKLEER